MSSVTGLNSFRTLPPAIATEHSASSADTPSTGGSVVSNDALKAARTNVLVGGLVILRHRRLSGRTTLGRDLDSEMNEAGDRHGTEINPSSRCFRFRSSWRRRDMERN